MPVKTAAVHTRQGLARCLELTRPSVNFHWCKKQRKDKQKTSWLFIFSSVMAHYAGKEGKVAAGSSKRIYTSLTRKFTMPQVLPNLAAFQVYLFTPSCFLMASQEAVLAQCLLSQLLALVRYAGALLGSGPGLWE